MYLASAIKSCFIHSKEKQLRMWNLSNVVYLGGTASQRRLMLFKHMMTVTVLLNRNKRSNAITR